MRREVLLLVLVVLLHVVLVVVLWWLLVEVRHGGRGNQGACIERLLCKRPTAHHTRGHWAVYIAAISYPVEGQPQRGQHQWR
jgi:hypothetical protein